MRSFLSMAIFVIANVLIAPAHASEGMFNYSYTAETTPKGAWDYEQKHYLRTGKARGEYTSVKVRNELEYGITNHLQGSLYLNSTYFRMKNAYDPDDLTATLPDRHDFNIDGVSLKLLYRVLSPYSDGWGFAFYVEPEIGLRDKITGDDRIERALETRLIFQKNFLDDELLTVFNIMIEPEWVKDRGQHLKELYVEFTAGAIYRLKDKWFLGLELRNHMEYPEFNLGHQEHSAYFAGPVLHYGSQKYWWTLTVLPQVWGWPRQLGHDASGKMLGSHNAHLGQHEKLEIGFSFGIPFGEGHSHGPGGHH